MLPGKAQAEDFGVFLGLLNTFSGVLVPGLRLDEGDREP